MGGYWNALKESVKAFKADDGPSEYRVAGRTIKCPHCDHQKFIEGRALLNRAGSTFFNFDWADPSATTLVCAECSRIEWFAEEPERVSD